MSNKLKEFYEFEGFRLDTENPCLWRGNELIPIPPKALEILILLVKKQGEIVSRNELLENVWRETFVEESNINYTISLIRKALGEKDLIQTIPRRGYRFVGRFKEEIPPPEIKKEIKKSTFRWILASIFLITLFFVTSFAFWVRMENKPLPTVDNPEAIQAYNRGKAILDDRDVKNREEKALAEFQKAVTLDPTSAIAHAGLAEGFSSLAVIRSGENGIENYSKAKAAAEKALILDKNLSEAFEIRGWLKRNADWDLSGAEKDLKHAIQLKPEFALAHYRLSQTLAPQGKFSEALSEINKAYELDPVSEVISQGRFSILESGGEYEKSLILAKEFLSDNPSNPGAKRAYGTFLYHQKQFDKVIEFEDEIFARNPERKPFPWVSLIGAAYFQIGNNAKAEELLDELTKQSQSDTKALYSLAMNYSEMSRIDDAMTTLEKCFLQHEERMIWLKVEPRFSNLRNNPRFIELLRKLKLD
ncbi:MAG: winged helix-turn-helix domain-containing protein [Pyrinomonadaceae bacterium]|nr:winged helix-turn-helix domain-containing protein [Pyrinomonadaceae bacterium]